MQTVSKIITALGILSLSISTLSATGASPEELFKTNCVSCHVVMKPQDTSKLIAPPISAAIMHVKKKYDNKEDAVRFMIDYIHNPSKEKAVCESSTVKRFGLMPSLKDSISEEDIKKLTSYLYDKHGKKGASCANGDCGKSDCGKKSCANKGKHKGKSSCASK